MAKVSFTKASAPQLLAFATTHLGLEIEPGTTAAVLRTKITEAGFSGSEIDVEDEASARPRAPLTADDVAGRRTVRINIPSQDTPGGDEAVPVGVNGRVARIMRGVDVDVPVEYVQVLQNAKKMVFDKDKEGRLTNPRLVPIYPFSIVGVID